MILAILASAAVLAAPAHQGRAVVECRVASTGRLSACVVLSETPANANVGAFALKLAKNFRPAPNDRRIRNGKIRIAMQFELP